MLERFAACGALMLGATACTGSGCTTSGAGIPGELGNGAFHYGCVGPGDRACKNAGVQVQGNYTLTWGSTEVPSVIAVGGAFGLQYGDYDFEIVPDGQGLVPASPSMVTISTGKVTIGAPGFQSFLARSEDGILDFVHLPAAEVGEIAVERNGEKISSLTIAAGDSADLAAVPSDDDGKELAGSLGFAWTSTDDAVVAVTVDSSDDEVTIEAKAAGTATVHVTAEGIGADLEVTVNP